MDLLQLEHFLAVVEEGTFTRAAERVSRTQPAVSQSIKKLEEEIGGQLFARDLHDVSLTEAGKTLLEYARKMVRARDDAMRELGALKALKTGTLNIAAHESAAVYLLPAPLRNYLTRFPDVRVGIYRSPLAEIPRQVMDREVHVGFVKDEPGFHELKCIEVHADEMILVAPPRHPLAGRHGVRVRDLGAEHFVVHHLCSTTEQKILRLFEQHSTRCHIAAELWSFENIKGFVQAFRQGDFTLETLVPDEPISVPSGIVDVPKWISNYDGVFKGLIPVREALAESRNAVAIWITAQIGIGAVLRTSRSLGVQTPLQRYATTALGASEVNLLELATAYRTIASGVLAQPYVIRRIVLRDSGDAVGQDEHHIPPTAMADGALSLIQEGLRGVVRIPTGTAHALDSRAFPIAVMGKTGTTNEFRDALFVGSTYGVDGITVAVRIGFDDNRSLGSRETGGRVALPVFRELMLSMYRGNIVGPPPSFPAQMEQRITQYLQGGEPPPVASAVSSAAQSGTREQ